MLVSFPALGGSKVLYMTDEPLCLTAQQTMKYNVVQNLIQ